MPAIDERLELGLAVIAEMMSQEFSTTMRRTIAADGFGATLARFGVEHSFADVWARDGMERKTRSLVLIGALIGMRQPDELRNHIRIGLNNGLTKRDIEEALITVGPYVGLAGIGSAFTAALEVLREQGLLADERTPQEQGLL